MSLVSNFIGGISSSQFGNALGVSNNFDLNDSTFADILNKQMETQPTQEPQNILGQLGIPAGFQIDGIDFAETALDQIEAVGEKIGIEKEDFNNLFDTNKDNEITTSEVATFFTSLLEKNTTGQENRSELFDFAQKQASNMYNKFAKSMVTTLEEFVTDAREILS